MVISTVYPVPTTFILLVAIAVSYFYNISRHNAMSSLYRLMSQESHTIPLALHLDRLTARDLEVGNEWFAS